MVAHRCIVSKITLTHLHQPLRSYMNRFGTLEQLPPLCPSKNCIAQGKGQVTNILFLSGIPMLFVT